MKGQKFISKSAAQTKLLGIKLAKQLNGNEVIALVGNLGSGKTTFVKGLAKGLGVKDVITSPTFVLMKNYKAKHKTIKNFVHVDCYRIPGIELTAIGLGDFLNQADTVVAIEWAEKLPKKFKPKLVLNFVNTKQPNTRLIKIKSPQDR
ncbi:MAG: hypothetical protein UV57_C0045G0008 [Parcubacteria group bacterium GW2011_GWD2_43_10]|uniref:tRNA threonylcarbamoyladenosine biosynthesis protein TsaE n=3 Tax=Candidatus Vebleniibacteriota TaxID=1817921 RepID=A0A1G2Q6Z3_9BACT|nr:MAG: hypothetical protein UV57_C0045G0008 [Parcubacteria group bacterium GW2011_GWD2_43_10]OHA54790.1 MAG: tRNA (adenosine(37)-N6)-threonylcarbamoyltransferase complex ATPase subunit type 1 TsaE [Candidatus Veblenbacteria bacterium RIFOXYA2_FULL_43_9]OHA56114.1 MAG: tRNA (adenosine(37)-N6)-threonylcarbamoyltransferase complex ATPase subunit type 1 TsaE [Candidatus Veblenbacteria bacterium RIFOXYC2_FULL_42_11]OHA56308.1 MAG: tRNA (adenosine(37)-N6)-threonylcarbamoyltransferase complex ATPase s